jgi:hypothetical protein
MRSVLGVVVALLIASRAGAQLASAELFVNIHANSSAVDEQGHSDTPTPFADGPRTANVLGGSGNIPWSLQSVVTGAEAESNGHVNYLATSQQIVIGGMFRIELASTAPATAGAGFDAIAKISFTVSEETPYSIGGGVSATRALRDDEVVACQINGTVLAGDTRATPLAAGAYGIAYQSVAFPGETIDLECSAAASGGTADANSVAFDVTLNLGGTPATTTSTTLQPLTKRQCRKACRKGIAACRAACGSLDRPERKACRKSCKQRGRQCGQPSGCNLPVG